MKVSKDRNPLNVLHYKVEVDKQSCAIVGEIYGEWHLGEDGPNERQLLADSWSKIRKPLSPTTTRVSDHRIEFTTKAMKEFQDKKI